MNEKRPQWPEGTLELYVLGALPGAEALEIEAWTAKDPAFREEVDQLRSTLEKAARYNGRSPLAETRTRLLQRIDQLEASRSVDEPPFLNVFSKVEDYKKWTAPVEERLRASLAEFDCVRIGKSADTETFYVKMVVGVPEEVHSDLIERILIVEGDCVFHVGDGQTSLKPGQQFTIPLHLPHHGYTTSAYPCLFILQRTTITA